MKAAACRDPDDDAILGTAIAGNAACIVTGDDDLLIVKRFHRLTLCGLRNLQSMKQPRQGKTPNSHSNQTPARVCT
ncbi:MAG: putative toxin-antitoxin system toxin component, PIN family [Anaerolineae bacterium]